MFDPEACYAPVIAPASKLTPCGVDEVTLIDWLPRGSPAPFFALLGTLIFAFIIVEIFIFYPALFIIAHLFKQQIICV